MRPLVLVLNCAGSELQVLQPQAALLHVDTLAEAQRQVFEREVNLVLVDLNPAGEGLALCRWLKSQPLLADIPVIGICDEGETLVAPTAIAAGVQDLVQRPILAPLLLSRVMGCVAQHAVSHIPLATLSMEISASLLTSTGPRLQELIDQAIRRLTQFAGAARGCLYLFSQDELIVSGVYEWCVEPSQSMRARVLGVPLTSFGHILSRLLRGEVIRLSRPEDYPEHALAEREWTCVNGFQPALIVPLSDESRLVGAIGLYAARGTQHAWPERLAFLLKNLGTAIISAVQRDAANTARAERDEQLRSTLDAIQDAVIATDLQHQITWMNPAAEALIGSPIALARGRGLCSLLPLRDPTTREPPEPSAVEGAVLALLSADGAPDRHLSCARSPIRADDGRPTGLVWALRDVSEEQRGREALRTSEAENRAMLSVIPDMMFVVSKDGVILDIHAPREDMLIMPKAQQIGLNLIQELPPKVAEDLKKLLLTCTDPGSPSSMEYEVPQIADRRFEARATTIDTNRVLIVVREITERTLMERELRLYKRMVDAVPEFISMVGADSRYQVVNETYIRVFNRPREDFIGAHVADIIGPEEYYRWTHPALELTQRGESTMVERYHTFPTMGERLLNVHYTPVFEPDGSVRGAVIRVHDITETRRLDAARQASDERLRQFLNTCQEGFIYLDHHLRVLDMNQQLESIIGYSRAEMLGKSIPDLLAFGVANEIDARFTRLPEGRSIRLERKIKHKDGQPRHVLVSAVRMAIAPGESPGLMAMITDITEHKRTEEALRRAQKMDAVGQLTGGIAHDFNNLLGIILGNLDLMEMQRSMDERQLKRLDGIRKAGRRGAELTRQLLGFSRREPTQTLPTDLAQLIRGMSALIERSITPEVQVEYTFSRPLDPVAIDPSDFQDALLNLILNARDAMPYGGKLRIGLRNLVLDESYGDGVTELKPGPCVELSITDTGHGMPPEVMARIFEPFYTTKPPGVGTGLGLAMVFGFVTRSNGHITVSSAPSQGTTFRMLLPSATGKPTPSPDLPTELSPPPAGKGTILVVDDEAALREIAQEVLVAQGYEVLSAANGPEAMGVLRGHPEIKLLLSDMVMPGGMHGLELARQAQALRPRLQVLLSTGYSLDLSHRAGTLTNYTVLRKPYSRAELLLRVKDTLESAVPAQPLDAASLSR